MVLAIPVQVVAISPDGSGLIEVDGLRRRISLLLVEDVGVGDYVIVHLGHALCRLDPDEAERALWLHSGEPGEFPAME